MSDRSLARIRALARLLAACCLALAVVPAAAYPGPSCPSVPSGIELQPGELLRFGDLTFGVATGFRPEPSAARHGSAETRGTLAIDLVVSVMDPETRQPRIGSMVPGFDVGFTLEGLSGVIASGPLEYHLSSHGPAYGAEVPLDGGQAGPLELSLDIAGSPRFGTDHADHPEDPSACPAAPDNIHALIDLTSLLAAAGGDSGAGVDQANVRSVLVGTLDPRPSDSYSDIWGYNDGVTYLAIMGSTNGTLFIDVTDPANPVEVGYIGGPSSSWRDIKTYVKDGNAYAYIVTEGSGAGEGLQVVEITDPLNPVLLNTLTTSFTTAHNIYIDTAQGHAWGIGTDNGTRVLDLAADPVNPPEIGSFTERYVHDAYVAGGLAQLSEINNGQHEVADSSDVSNIQTLSRWNTPGNAAHNGWANQSNTIVATTDETSTGHIAVYDITDPANPSAVLGEYQPHPTASVHNVMFDDQDNEIIAMAYYALGWKYVDLHRPTAPVELAGYDSYGSGDTGFNGAWGIYTFDPRGYDYLSDISTGLYVLDYAPTGGTLSGVVRDAGDGTPVPEARVVVLANGTEAFSAPDGVFAVYAEEGEVQLRVSAWGFRTALLNAGTMPLGGRVDADVELARLPRVSLSGTISSAADASPIEGATVRIVGTSLVAVSGPDGSYQFADVAVGQQTVTAEAAGFSSDEGRIVLAAGADGTVDLALEPAMLVDDVESDLGWTLGLGGDTATSGEWERVDPNGTGGGNVQPEDDHTADPADTAFITGQSNPGASTEANDVENGFTTLLSPTIDVSGLGAAQIRYYRWVSASSGFLSGGTLRVEISLNGGASWAQLENVGQANQWNARQFDVGSFGPLSNELRVRFRAEATSGFQNYRVLEAGVDDFEVVRACGARFNPAAGDADADGIVDGCDGCPLDPANDADGDGVCGDLDNAVFAANAGQEDADGDGVGDVIDNCGADPNADQRDLDRDGLGDACDPDLDGDGIVDGSDTDRDDDGVDDAVDLCPSVPDAPQADDDLDGEGDACDPDDGLVQGLEVSGARMSWEPESGSDGYNLYRGDLGAPGLVALAACRRSGATATFGIDHDLPVPGDGFFYLVARIAAGVEGSLGRDSAGIERSIASPCP